AYTAPPRRSTPPRDGCFQGVWLRLVVVGGQRSHDGLASFVVVPHHRGQREDPGQDAGDDALGGLAAVSFQVKLPLEGPVDRLYDLAQRLEQVLPGAPGLALADRP